MKERKKADIHIRVKESWLKTIKDLAAKDNRKQTAIIEIALERYLKLRKVI